jgi:hypothetical protein
MRLLLAEAGRFPKSALVVKRIEHLPSLFSVGTFFSILQDRIYRIEIKNGVKISKNILNVGGHANIGSADLRGRSCDRFWKDR